MILTPLLPAAPAADGVAAATAAHPAPCAADAVHLVEEYYILGAALRALSKRIRTLRSDSPTYMLSSSPPLTEKKLHLAAVAMAWAAIVFEQPGGP